MNHVFCIYRVLRKDGRIVLVEAHGKPVRSKGSRSRRLTAIRDITERKKTEEAPVCLCES